MSEPLDAPLLADDPTHPIAYVQRLDMIGKLRVGGAELMMIISQPLQGDRRSFERLMTKLSYYFGFAASPEFRAEFDPPEGQPTCVRVQINAESDPQMIEALRRCAPWAAEHNARLEVETR
jgi:hypothetical protein